jgi:ATP-dependent Clp protease ATP-binding subunit ClpA
MMVSGKYWKIKILEDNGITQSSIWKSLAERQSGKPLGEGDAAALRSIGIDLDAVRASLEAAFGADALGRVAPQEKPRGRFGFGEGMNFGHIPFTREAKKTLELSLREALARGDKSIEAAHLLLGVLRGANEPTRELLGGGDGVSALRRAALELLDRAA